MNELTLELSRQEADLLLIIMDMWDESCLESIKCITSDPSVQSVGELLELTGSLMEERSIVGSVRTRLFEKKKDATSAT